MRITCDGELDVLRILLSDAPIEESDEVSPGVVMDYDASGNLVGLEIRVVSQRVDNPQSVQFSVLPLVHAH